MTNHVMLFDSCYLTIGFSRSTIVDHQRKKIYIVPNEISSLFINNSFIKYNDIINNINIKYHIDYLIDNEVCFFCDELLIDNFIKINYNIWDYPSDLTNAIIEIDIYNSTTVFNTTKLLINQYNLCHIEFNIVSKLDIELLNNLLCMFNELDIHSYNLIFSVVEDVPLEEVISILLNEHKISNSIIHTARYNEVYYFNDGQSRLSVINSIFSYKTCGIIEQNQFVLDINHISESLNHNTCLNRKITISANGDIKNCPNTSVVYGNINNYNVSDIVSSSQFRSLWNIKKDDIEICKICEYRNVCTDCRAFTETPNNIYSKPLKCGYDPVECKWEDWYTNKFKNYLIEYYEL